MFSVEHLTYVPWEITCEDKDQGQQKSYKVVEGPVKAQMATDIVERGGAHLEVSFLWNLFNIFLHGKRECDPRMHRRRWNK